MIDQPNKLDLRSHCTVEDKRQELLRLFPEIHTEGDKLDFERLKLALGESVDIGKERYGMNWPGKADCLKTIQMPSLATLRPCSEESINFETTENLIIEGDNLEVLKLLQKSYLGKVKMIYIDPPYNTGNDFIYPDNYSESLQTYLEYTGQVDAEGKKFSTNAETDGRFHSKWLNMMYPRLYLARNLLQEDGVIFISIDDGEVRNLRAICDDIFGESYFLGMVTRISKTTSFRGNYFAPSKDYLVVYAKEQTAVTRFKDEIDETQYVKVEAEGPRKGEKYRDDIAFYLSTLETRPNQRYFITCPDGSKVIPPGKTFPPDKPIAGDGVWRWSKETYTHKKDLIVFKKMSRSPLIDASSNQAQWNLYTKSYFKDKEEVGNLPRDVWDSFLNRHGSAELEELSIPYDFPKPANLITHMIKITRSQDDSIILDFFAGSGTAAHAVLALNDQDGGRRKFILVQLPEPLDPADKNQKTAVTFCDGIGKPHNIAEITKERVRRVIQKLNQKDEGKLPDEGTQKQDRGFKVLKLAESNFKPWNADVPHDTPALEKQLDLHVDHIRDGRTADDLLYEILLKSGFPLSTPVEALKLAGKTVHSVAGGALFICLEGALTLELIRAMAEKKPERVVCLDEGFAGNDQLKANAVQIFKTKGVTSFKTV